MRDGSILDSRYRISRRLAEGGFGAIYQATDIVMGREVALKVLHRELAADASMVARFRREAEALARLRDQHTITMYDVGIAADGTHFIVLELLRGESLFEQFRTHGAMPWRRVATIARGVCSSLREAHGEGIVHRDLKPANIHLEVSAMNERDFVKVLDFGIAKLVDGESAGADLTLAGQMIGTFDYMPPEQLVGDACTGRSDVFTLAIVMYEMIVGERPFGEAQGPAGRLMTMLTTELAPLSSRADVPPALSDVVMRALSREPNDRMDVDELDEILAQLLDATASYKPAPKQAAQEDIGALIDEAVASLDDGASLADTRLAEGTLDATRLAEGTVDTDAQEDDDDDETWIGAPPQMTMVGPAPTPAATQPRTTASRFAVGSRTEIPPAKAAAAKLVAASVSLRTAPSSAKAVDPQAQEASIREPLRRTPSNLVDASQTPRPGPRKAREIVMEHARVLEAQATRASVPSEAAAMPSHDAFAQTARQPVRPSTPRDVSAATPRDLTTSHAHHSHAHHSHAQTARQPARPITPPVIRMKTPATANPVWISGRPTPSEAALPPPPLTPTGHLPAIPARMASGTSPIVNKPATPLARYVLWAVALFGVGFAAALGLAAL